MSSVQHKSIRCWALFETGGLLIVAVISLSHSVSVLIKLKYNNQTRTTAVNIHIHLYCRIGRSNARPARVKNAASVVDIVWAGALHVAGSLSGSLMLRPCFGLVHVSSTELSTLTRWVIAKPISIDLSGKNSPLPPCFATTPHCLFHADIIWLNSRCLTVWPKTTTETR